MKFLLFTLVLLGVVYFDTIELIKRAADRDVGFYCIDIILIQTARCGPTNITLHNFVYDHNPMVHVL